MTRKSMTVQWSEAGVLTFSDEDLRWADAMAAPPGTFTMLGMRVYVTYRSGRTAELIDGKWHLIPLPRPWKLTNAQLRRARRKR